MPIIRLETLIHSEIEVCFDVSHSIDLHKISMAHTNERATRGTTSGLIGLGESVTWEAIHFGIKQTLTSKITAYERPFHFRDEQVTGAFKSMVHDHYFVKQPNGVLMKDSFNFESPFGAIGRMVNEVILIKISNQSPSGSEYNRKRICGITEMENADV